jgi:hypothetical protein
MRTLEAFTGAMVPAAASGTSSKDSAKLEELRSCWNGSESDESDECVGSAESDAQCDGGKHAKKRDSSPPRSYYSARKQERPDPSVSSGNTGRGGEGSSGSGSGSASRTSPTPTRPPPDPPMVIDI